MYSACPECRIPSDYVCPSAFWVETKDEKEKLITDYKKALGEKDCKYFKKVCAMAESACILALLLFGLFCFLSRAKESVHLAINVFISMLSRVASESTSAYQNETKGKFNEQMMRFWIFSM